MLAVHEIRAYMATFEGTLRADVAMTKRATFLRASRNSATLRRRLIASVHDKSRILCFVAVVSPETAEWTHNEQAACTYNANRSRRICSGWLVFRSCTARATYT